MTRATAVVVAVATDESRRVADAITRGYVLGAIALLTSVVLTIGFAVRTKGGSMRIHNWRFWLGVACLAAAAIVGIVGYLQLSEEPLVNHQIPYLASAGMALVVLSVLGGSLIVAEQVRADERTLAELEAAVEALAAAIAPAIEAPPRRAVVTPQADPDA
jgi:uncharacterized membrane protein